MAHLLGELGAYRTVPRGSKPELVPLTPVLVTVFSKKGCTVHGEFKEIPGHIQRKPAGSGVTNLVNAQKVFAT